MIWANVSLNWIMKNCSFRDEGLTEDEEDAGRVLPHINNGLLNFCFSRISPFRKIAYSEYFLENTLVRIHFDPVTLIQAEVIPFFINKVKIWILWAKRFDRKLQKHLTLKIPQTWISVQISTADIMSPSACNHDDEPGLLCPLWLSHFSRPADMPFLVCYKIGLWVVKNEFTFLQSGVTLEKSSTSGRLSGTNEMGRNQRPLSRNFRTTKQRLGMGRYDFNERFTHLSRVRANSVWGCSYTFT